MSTSPRIFPGDHPTLDVMEALSSVTIIASELKAGMVLLDPDFLTPVVSLDHRMRTRRGSGTVTFMGFDLEAKRFTTVDLGVNAPVFVAAK